MDYRKKPNVTKKLTNVVYWLIMPGFLFAYLLSKLFQFLGFFDSNRGKNEYIIVTAFFAVGFSVVIYVLIAMWLFSYLPN